MLVLGTISVPSIIFLSMENWDEVWRRNQFVCAGLVRRNPGLRILFVGLALDVSHAIRTRNLSALKKQGLQTAADYPAITLLRPVKWLPNSITLGRKFNEAALRRQVRRQAAALGMQSPLLWLNPHYAEHLAGTMGESAVIYDITDDWTQLSQSPRERDLVTRQDRDLCQKADAVIVCSQRLYELKQVLAKRVELIPNGVDVGHYVGALESDEPAAPETSGWTAPVFGYTGTLHPDRVDVNLVAELAKAFPEGTVALVGPDYLDDAARSILNREPNIILTGPVPYTRLPYYVKKFDVCITPHLMTAFTESLNPIKLWEYLAIGKPVVSTDVAGFRDYPELVRIAQNTEDFIQLSQEALLEGDTLAAIRRTHARKHSWDARLDQVESVLESLTSEAITANNAIRT